MMTSLKIVFSITLWSTFLLMVILFNPFLVLRQRKKETKIMSSLCIRNFAFCSLYASFRVSIFLWFKVSPDATKPLKWLLLWLHKIQNYFHLNGWAPRVTLKQIKQKVTATLNDHMVTKMPKNFCFFLYFFSL